MAQPIEFIPTLADPRTEMQRRLAEAPTEHAEALLVAYDLLDEAHRQGLLDAIHGAISARDTIFGLLAKYSADPACIDAMRNTLGFTKILGSIDPGTLSRLSKETFDAMETHRREERPPSLWQIFKRMREPETRRGLSFLTLMLGSLGRALR